MKTLGDAIRSQCFSQTKLILCQTMLDYKGLFVFELNATEIVRQRFKQLRNESVV